MVKNTGNVSIDADAKVTTRYFFGLTLIKHGGQYPILRGDTSDWSFELKRPFWGGLYQSQFTVAYDDAKEATVGVQTGSTLVVLKSPRIWFWSMPTWAGLIIELIFLLCIFAIISLMRLSKKRKQWILDNWIEYTTKTGDDIRTLAEKFDVSWKLLAQVNKIEAPYTLKKGGILSVPPVYTPEPIKITKKPKPRKKV